MNADAAQSSHATATASTVPAPLPLRQVLLAAWNAAQLSAGEELAITLSHEAAAGQLLSQLGHVRAAINRCPTDGWWERVFALLLIVFREECCP